MSETNYTQAEIDAVLRQGRANGRCEECGSVVYFDDANDGYSPCCNEPVVF